MSRALLDVNVLLALLDGGHVDHERAWGWAEHELSSGWASCTLTENGVVRILSRPRYPSPVSCCEAITLLRDARAGTDHEFWACDLSLLDEAVVDPVRLHGAAQITDAYLLALAAARGGRFVTFDRRLSLDVVRGADASHLLVL